MRIIITLIASVSMIAASAQDSCNIETKEDKFENTRVHSLTSFIPIDNTSYLVMVADKRGSTITVTFGVPTDKLIRCFRKGAKAIFLLDDGSKATFAHDDELNCNGYYVISVQVPTNSDKSDSQEFNKLVSRKVKAIRFYGTEGFFDLEFSSDNAGSKIYRGLNCLVKEK